MRGLLIISTIIASVLAFTNITNAATRTGLTRPEIKAMPITERPNRPGHFYGNTVRRNNGR